LPRELADELREADPEPCPVCDAMPHRKRLVVGSTPIQQPRAVTAVSSPRAPVQAGWLAGLLNLLRLHRA